MTRYKVTFKMVPAAMVSRLVECDIFPRIEIQKVNFLDHVQELKGPDPSLDDKVDIVAFSPIQHMVDLVNAMHERMVNGLWLQLEKIGVLP